MKHANGEQDLSAYADHDGGIQAADGDALWPSRDLQHVLYLRRSSPDEDGKELVLAMRDTRLRGFPVRRQRVVLPESLCRPKCAGHDGGIQAKLKE